MTTPDTDATGQPHLHIANAADELLLAMTRVEAALAVVLVHIAEIQREVAKRPPLHRDRAPAQPDDSWADTP